MFENLKDKAGLEKGLDMLSKLGKVNNLEDLFTGDFMTQFTDFNNIKSFLKAGDFNVSSLKDFKNLDMGLLNTFVKSNSQFSDWKSMLEKASSLIK